MAKTAKKIARLNGSRGGQLWARRRAVGFTRTRRARLCLTPFIHVPVPEDGAELRYSQAAADRVLQFFSLLVFGQNEWAGKPFELLPWQTQLIREFYGVQVKDDDGAWVRYRRFLYSEIPKKNGKSELAAGLGLYHLLADGENLPNVPLIFPPPFPPPNPPKVT